MGRESRQARRARERRERQRKQVSKGTNWALLGGIGVVVIALLAFGTVALKGMAAGSHKPATVAEAPGKTIDGIKCGSLNMSILYHKHAHLTILQNGKPVTVPAQIGYNYNHDCLYWVHTHQTDGIIHMEAPHKITPALGEFFDDWAKTNSQNTGVLKTIEHHSKPMKVWVNQKPYHGNPRSILLHPHTTVTIDIGAPFRQPAPYHFPQGD